MISVFSDTFIDFINMDLIVYLDICPACSVLGPYICYRREVYAT